MKYKVLVTWEHERYCDSFPVTCDSEYRATIVREALLIAQRSGHGIILKNQRESAHVIAVSPVYTEEG